MPWHPGAGAGCSEQRPGGTVALGYIHTYILGGRYRDAVTRSPPAARGTVPGSSRLSISGLFGCYRSDSATLAGSTRCSSPFTPKAPSFIAFTLWAELSPWWLELLLSATSGRTASLLTSPRPQRRG